MWLGVFFFSLCIISWTLWTLFIVCSLIFLWWQAVLSHYFFKDPILYSSPSGTPVFYRLTHLASSLPCFVSFVLFAFLISMFCFVCLNFPLLYPFLMSSGNVLWTDLSSHCFVFQQHAFYYLTYLFKHKMEVKRIAVYEFLQFPSL